MKWERHVTRRLAIQVAIAWNFGYGTLMEKRYGTSINDTLVYYDGNKTEYYVDKKQCKKFHKDLDKFLINRDKVWGIIPEVKYHVEETYDYIKNLIKNSKELNNKDLAELYKQFSHHHADYYTRMWMGFRICERIIKRLEKYLKKEDILTLSEQIRPNEITQLNRDLSLGMKAQELFKKYKHIPMFDYDHEPYTIKDFENMKSNKIKNNNNYEVTLKKIKPNKRLYELVVMLRRAIYVRDYRDSIRQRLNLVIKPFYKEIGKRLTITVEETALLTNREIYYHLLNSKIFSKEEIKKRKESFLLIQIKNKYKVYSGDNAKNLAKKLKIKKEVKERKIIKGIQASPGKVKGKAKIIFTNKDLNKIKKGDIIVATMTRTDYITGMKLASGIITDEGGTTSHAAIIARELNIPCIVGTKNATEVLKDGDIVEIMDKGRIRKV